MYDVPLSVVALSSTVHMLSISTPSPIPKAVHTAARQAGASKHALIDLVRLVRTLDKQDPAGNRAVRRKRERLTQNVQFAQALLLVLREDNEGCVRCVRC